jgi:hypothetical protein
MDFQSAAGTFEDDDLLWGVVDGFLDLDAQISGAFAAYGSADVAEIVADRLAVRSAPKILDGVNHGMGWFMQSLAGIHCGFHPRDADARIGIVFFAAMGKHALNPLVGQPPRPRQVAGKFLGGVVVGAELGAGDGVQYFHFLDGFGFRCRHWQRGENTSCSAFVNVFFAVF